MVNLATEVAAPGTRAAGVSGRAETQRVEKRGADPDDREAGHGRGRIRAHHGEYESGGADQAAGAEQTLSLHAGGDPVADHAAGRLRGGKRRNGE
jgi:hypothetical protein